MPPGDYEVVCRHEPMDRREVSLGGSSLRHESGPAVEVRRRVRVRPEETVALDFNVQAPR